ncbi:MAG: energy transducer TonB [Luteimonas sp.]
MTDTTHPTSAQLQDDAPRRGATPLLWILLVLAAIALAWWLFAQGRLGNTGAAGTVTVTTPADAQATATAASEAGGSHGTATARAHGKNAKARATATATTAATRTAALLAHEQPAYPVAAARRGAEGTVMLQIAIDANGVPTDIGYAQRSGDADLDRAARTAARDWRFRPALRDGRAVATTVNVPVRFILPSAQG